METRRLMETGLHQRRNIVSLSRNLAIGDATQAPEALTASKDGLGRTLVRVLAKVADHYDADLMASQGIVTGSRIGDIVTMQLTFDQLAVLDEYDGIVYYEIARRVAPTCDRTRFDTKADSVQAGYDLPQGFDGDGVIVGVTDWGFDYTHPNFYKDGHSRIIGAWDQFRTQGPAPDGFQYGTEIMGLEALAEVQCDTFGLYGYGTHGSHVSGIAAGRGMGEGQYRGQAPGANLLMASFLLDEASWIDAVTWMKGVAEREGKRLVINSSWGMYTFSNLDGTSLLCQVIDRYSDEGIVFVTSGGNNGDENFHIKKTFTADMPDTLRTVAAYYSAGIGQALILWGEAGKDFEAAFGIAKNGGLVMSDFFSTSAPGSGNDGYVVIDGDTVHYDVMWEHSNPNNGTPHILMNVEKVGNDQLRLFVTATDGTVHAWNVCNLENHAGNMGSAFSRNSISRYSNGDAKYGVGEPGCATKTITVAAHTADRLNTSTGAMIYGGIANFSSLGPLINGTHKPEISAPGKNVVSSISSFTSETYSPSASTYLDGRRYIYAEMSGTSMSGPAVTGIVALMLQANPNLSADEVRDILFSTARNDSRTGDIRASGTMSDTWGWGKADAYAAVVEALQRLGIDDKGKLQKLPITVYPNPTNNAIKIATNSNRPETILIFGSNGQQLWQGAIVSEQTIDVSQWGNGVYIIKDATNGRVGKIVKM